MTDYPDDVDPDETPYDAGDGFVLDDSDLLDESDVGGIMIDESVNCLNCKRRKTCHFFTNLAESTAQFMQGQMQIPGMEFEANDPEDLLNEAPVDPGVLAVDCDDFEPDDNVKEPDEPLQ